MDHPINGKLPSVTETSFSCPHCGAYTSQSWSKYYGQFLGRDDPLPPQYELSKWESMLKAAKDPDAKDKLESLVAFVKRINTGKPFIEKKGTQDYPTFALVNVNTSKCYVCSDMAIWVHNRMIYPPSRLGEGPNPDLPDEIKVDFEEARAILGQSPRGGAALLRLCVQKLCGHLGEKGKNIDEDIASLVSKGLAPQIQQALDAVRVIGNEAVHPGKMDLKDDRATAEELLTIVNFIADEMITKPAKLKAIYDRLPPDKLKGIEQRNAKALGGAKEIPG